MHLHRKTSRPSIAIIGAESLLGKELRELLEASGLGADVRIVAGAESENATILTRSREEPVVMPSLPAADLDTARIIMLAGSKESSEKAYQHIRTLSSAPAVIDVNGGLEDQPETRLRAPMVEPAGFQADGALQAIAHPAAVALALFLIQLQKAATIRRAVVHVFEPVSERGQAGLDELQKQTAGLLSFKPLAKDVFDAQVSFNMLPQYGLGSAHSLADIESKIDRHLASLLATAGASPMPSLRVLHAPVFHGYTISVWAELENNPGIETVEQALASSNIDVRGKEHEPPTNVGVAGQGGITVGAITADSNDPKALWFWVVSDNLRIVAENAAEVAREILA